MRQRSSEVARLRLPCAVLCLVVSVTAIGCFNDGATKKSAEEVLASVELGVDDWHVEWSEGVHGAAPQYVVKIARSWTWPRPGAGELTFVAQARCGDAESVSLDSWPLVETERFTIFRPVTSERHGEFLRRRAELLSKIEGAERALAEQAPDPDLPRLKLLELLDLYDALPQPPYAELDALEASQAAALVCRFRLRAMLEDKEGPETKEKGAEKSSRTWGVAEADGKTPEEKAREKLDGFIDRICAHRVGDTAPYAEECRHLRERLRTGKIAIPCSMKGRNGALRFRDPPPGVDYGSDSGHPDLSWGTLGAPDGGVPISGVLFLDGDYLIDNQCALSTVLHEAAHSTDESFTPEEREYFDCRELLERFQEEAANALVEYHLAQVAHGQNPTDVNYEEMLRAFRARLEAEERRDEARDRCDALRETLGTPEVRERRQVQRECHAYAIEREALDSGLFGSLEDPDVMRWAKEDLVQALAAIGRHADENPGGKEVACECVMQAFRWLTDGGHEELRANLKEKKALDHAVVWHLANCSGLPPRY